MKLPQCSEVLLSLEGGILNLTLNRPHKRNAMNSVMVAELMRVFEAVDNGTEVRAVVIRGADGNFCSGGDISDMNSDSLPDADDNSDVRDASWHFNRSFGHLIAKVNRSPVLVVCMLEGVVLGGGFGLACISDLAIAKPTTMFAMPETSLGIIPAQIAPFVVARIGLTQARRLTLLGERLDGHAAKALGIVHHVSDDPEAVLVHSLKLFKKCAPNATAVTKRLILDVAERQGLEALLDRAADDFSKSILGAEGQEGTKAFIEKRKPSWAV
jgi:isohexenylglutaconyl-CoA hydratase